MWHPAVAVVAAAGVASFISTVAALPAGDTYVLHETRADVPRANWKRGERINPESIITIRIGLTQNNLDTGYDLLMAVSHPDSPNFGNHLTPQEVNDLFAPHKDTEAAVRQWLVDEGFGGAVIPYENKGWLAVKMPVREAERLFRAEYYEHEHDGAMKLGCDHYSLPQNIQHHIDYITPGVKLSPAMVKREVDIRGHVPWFPRHGPKSFPHETHAFNSPLAADSDLPANLLDCATNMTVSCYRALYGIPSNPVAVPGNSLGIYELGDFYAQSDIDATFAAFSPWVLNGTHPTPAFIDGAEAPVQADSPYNGGESDVDLTISIPLIYPQTVTLYQTDDLYYAEMELNDVRTGSMNTFLDALDGSYCSYTAYGITGDSPQYDAIYPDPNGYEGDLMCGVYKPTNVISASYGQSELDLPKNYTARQCNEFLKLGLQGVTIILASGDLGVGGFPYDGGSLGLDGCLGENQTVYNPNWPSGCPYVTSVGATMFQPGQTIRDPESVMQVPLAATLPFSNFSTAGGFSNYFARPAYQAAAVGTYFALHDPGHPWYVADANATNIGEGGGLYNRAGRGWPDVSANGAWFQLFRNSTLGHIFGTSLAAPLFASVVTLLNQERATAGKGPIGFINPALYANPGLLNDITNGSNPNCNSSGFAAVPGWDPVTGLGTPNYTALREYFLSH